jgi:hypothetical protein
MTISVENLSEKDFAVVFSAIREKILKDPIKYFVEDSNFINFSPTPAQKVALKCVFNKTLDPLEKFNINEETTDLLGNFDLVDVEYTEVELYELMTGFRYDKDDLESAKNRINLIVGRRGGKSTLASIIAVYSTFKVNWKSFLSKTPVATVAILSHSVDFSQEVLDILKTMFEDSEILTRLRNKKRKDTQSTFHLKIPFILDTGEVEYSEVAVKVGAASKKTTRGRAVCTLLTDEIAFWNLDATAAESDADVIKAVTPALAQFGRHGTIIKLSSPAIKQGVLWNEWSSREFLKSQGYIQFKAPSWVWNTILDKDFFKTEYVRDPTGFDTEYRANFVDSISNFILPDYVDMCVVKGVTFLPPSESNKTVYSAAIDAAFKSDRFAFTLVGNNEHRITTHVIKYWEGSRQNPVKAFEVAKYIRNVCKEFGINEVRADQHSYQPLREIFQTYGINLVENTFSLPYKRKIYFALKRLIHNQNIDLLDVPLLSKEIKELQVEQTPNGQIRIGHPQGGSDDLSDALAVATFAALEKSGTINIIMGEIAGSGNSLVKTDIYGKAFTAPSFDMLGGYSGFDKVLDNSSDWVKDPNSGKMVKKDQLEEEDSPNTDGPNFLF